MSDPSSSLKNAILVVEVALIGSLSTTSIRTTSMTARTSFANATYRFFINNSIIRHLAGLPRCRSL